MSRAASRRGLVVAALLLLIILVIADTLRPNSFLRGFFGGTPASRQEEVLDGIRRRGLPVPDRIGLVTPARGTVAQQPLPA